KIPKKSGTDFASPPDPGPSSTRFWPLRGRNEEGRRFFVNLSKKTNHGVGNFKPAVLIHFHFAADNPSTTSFCSRISDMEMPFMLSDVSVVPGATGVKNVEAWAGHDGYTTIERSR